MTSAYKKYDKERYETLLDNPYVKAWLDFISTTEGTTEHGYNTKFGGGRFESLDDHPNIVVKGRRGRIHTPAGRYQITRDTWADIKRNLGLSSFGEHEQDLGALYLLERAGALDDVLEGRISDAIGKTGETWSSLSSGVEARMTPKEEIEWFNVNANIPSATDQLMPKGVTPAIKNIVNAIEQKSPIPGVGNLVFGLQNVTPAILAEEMQKQATPPSPAEAEKLRQKETPTSSDLLTKTDIVTDEEDALAELVARRLSLQKEMTPPAVSELGELLSQAKARQIAQSQDDQMADWEQELLSDSLDAEADVLRHNAVSRFFGEDELTNTRLPPALEESIDRALRNI